MEYRLKDKLKRYKEFETFDERNKFIAKIEKNLYKIDKMYHPIPRNVKLGV